MYTQRFEQYYADARAIVESFMFLDNATIGLEPSETARSLGITAYNYPRMDGSTSVISLVSSLIQNMFEPQDDDRFFMWQQYDRVFSLSRTIPAYELLIGGYVDLIFVPEPSAHVLELAEAAGVELEFTPIAMEALVFITTINNPVDNITMEQVLQIYTDMSITNWAELGGYDGLITPHSRKLHSGSQTLMDNLVLQGREIHPDLRRFLVGGMFTMLDEVERFHPDGWLGPGPYEREPNTFALGYTVSGFLNRQDTIIKALAIDGVFPSRETILSGEYPLITNYFAVIRADSPADSPARRIAHWLATPEGQVVVESAGLIGLNPFETETEIIADYYAEEEETLEALGEIIVTAGLFWEEWSGSRAGRFAWENFVTWYDTPIILHLYEMDFLQLLPASGFESLSDIRSYLYQFYTESFLDRLLIYREFPPIVEYNNVLFSFAKRPLFSQPRWESAIHYLFELDGSRAVVEASVLHSTFFHMLPNLNFSADREEFYRELQEYILISNYVHSSTIPEELVTEVQYHITLINGRIDSKKTVSSNGVLEWSPFGLQ